MQLQENFTSSKKKYRYSMIPCGSTFQAERLLVRSLCDDSEEVREATTNVLLPSVLAWAHELDKLQSDLLELFLNQLELTLLVRI